MKKSRYRKIDLRLWADAKFRALSPLLPSAQALWLYLITGPHATSLPGLWTVGEAALCEQLRWTTADFRRCWGEVEGLGMAEADWSARVLWLPNTVRYNPPENPNVVKSWKTLMADVPECALKDRALAALATAIIRTPSLADAVLSTFPPAQTAQPSPETLCHTVPETLRHTVPCTVQQTVKQTSNSNSNSNSNSSSTPQPPANGGGGESARRPADTHTLPEETQEGRDRIRAACDRPDLHARARAVVAHYVAALGAHASATARAVVEVMNLLDANIGEAVLRLATDNYAAFAARDVPDPKYRFGPNTFFAGEWERFRLGVPDKPAQQVREGHPERPTRSRMEEMLERAKAAEEARERGGR